jgi:hypothetical protein
MTKKCILFFLFFIFFLQNFHAQTQKIKIEANGIALNQVFFELRDKYGIQFTFNDKALSDFKITSKREFETKEEAVSFLLEGLPFQFEINNEVFVIFAKQAEKLLDSKKYLKVSGQVVESGSFEPLPFSYIFINGRQVLSDQNGNFNFLAFSDDYIDLQISHLGYFTFDTIITQSLNKRFVLIPAVQELFEVKVDGFTFEKTLMIGNAPGLMSINQTIAPYLPGHGDNAIFNVLRLLPGILAAGEQTADLQIWGSYASQTKVEFDGFTLFGLKNHNDNIGVVNPLMVKNIRVLKGGYESIYDNRVGGIVQIIGKNGNQIKPSATVNINNSTLNLLGEIPFGKSSSLIGSWRQTYYELYNAYDLNISPSQPMISTSGSHSGSNGNSGMFDVLVVPDYKFSDANLKYTFNGANGESIAAGIYFGGDRYSYSVDGNYNSHQVKNNLEEKNKQSGSSLIITRPWGFAHNSQLKLNFSKLISSSAESNSTNMQDTHPMGGHSMKVMKNENEVIEYAAELTDNFSFLPGTDFKAGIGWQKNQIVFNQSLNESNQFDLNSVSDKGYAFVQNTFLIGKKLQLIPGLRLVYENLAGGFYVEPRFSASLKLSEPVKFNASWGKYHQFISKISFVDENLNYSWYWVNSDGKNYPVLDATHWVGGISYAKNNFLVNIEGFYKSIAGISRYFSGTTEIDKGFYDGNGRSYGIDIYLKKEFKKNIFWISYTLSKSEENLSLDTYGNYRLAPHDQTHELKFAGIYNLKSFYFSANYVFGSGFEILKNYTPESVSVPTYNRLDIAVVYKFSLKKLYGNIGVSVLNVLNQENIKYDNLKRVETGTLDFANIYSGATPFSPTIFLKLQI